MWVCILILKEHLQLLKKTTFEIRELSQIKAFSVVFHICKISKDEFVHFRFYNRFYNNQIQGDRQYGAIIGNPLEFEHAQFTETIAKYES